MRRPLICLLFVMTAGVGLVLPLRHGEARMAPPQAVTQAPVTGQLQDGSAFRGQLTIHAFTIDETGQLTATGILTGTATSSPGAETKLLPYPFTGPASLIDLRGSCTTVVLDLAPIPLAPLEQEVSLVPVILLRVSPQAASFPPPASLPQTAHLLRTTLCALAHLQDEAHLQDDSRPDTMP